VVRPIPLAKIIGPFATSRRSNYSLTERREAQACRWTFGDQRPSDHPGRGRFTSAESSPPRRRGTPAGPQGRDIGAASGRNPSSQREGADAAEGERETPCELQPRVRSADSLLCMVPVRTPESRGIAPESGRQAGAPCLRVPLRPHEGEQVTVAHVMVGGVGSRARPPVADCEAI
jgi:hypothetical protein